MAEGTNVGAIYYEVEADTSKLVNSVTPVDKSLDGLNKTFSRTDKAANQANFRMTKTAAAVKSLGRESSQTSATMHALSGVIKGLLTIQTARAILSAADAWTALQNRLRLVTDGQRELGQATADVFRIAQDTSQEIDSIAQVYQRFAQNAGSLGLSLKDVGEVTEIVAKAVAVSGASAQAAEAALTQFGQALASGVLRGEELNSVMEQTPALAKAIADGMGITIGQLRAVAAEGKITATELIEALRKSAASVETQFSTRVKTAGQAMTELRNSVMRYIGEANESAALTRSLADGIERVSRAIDNADVDSFAREIEGLKATVALVMDGVDALMSGAASGAEGATTRINSSFSEMALSTAQEVDGIAKVFQGTAGAIAAVWEALANNIPAYFSNAWGEVKASAAGFVNDLADLINKPIQALGGTGIGHVEVDTAPIQAVRSLTEAARDGWAEAAKGVGAYERTLKRVTDNAIYASIAEWESDYADSTNKSTAATNARAASSEKLTAAQRKEIKAHEADKKVLDELATTLVQAGLEGEELAAAKARARMSVFATPEEVANVDALARALYQVAQAQADQQLINQADPIQGELERYAEQLAAYQDLRDRMRITDDEYYQYRAEAERAHEETMLALQEERFRRQSEFNNLLMTGIDAFGQAATEAIAGVLSGTANAAEAARAFANVILREVVGSFVQMGVQHVKAIIMGRVAESAAGAAYAAAVAGQVQATTALAAQATFASISAIPIIGPSMAPAWAASAAAQAAAMGAPAIPAAAISGQRQYGGPVDPSGLYRINETGKPEILNLANGQQFLLPNQRGEVVSNRDATRDAAGARAKTVHNHITFAPVIHATWPLPDKEVRRLVKQLNDAVEDGMIIT